MIASEELSVLLVSPAVPYPPIWGSGMRLYQLIRHLSARHAVSLLTYVPPDEADGVRVLGELCEAVYTVPLASMSGRDKRRAQLASLLSPVSFSRRSLNLAAMQSAIRRLLAQRRYDLVQVESSHLGGLDFGSDAVVLLDEHNIEYELLQRSYRTERALTRKLYNFVEYAKCRREEWDYWRRVAGCIVTSAREEAVVRRHAPGTPTAVVPNGVDTLYFRPAGIPPSPDSIVFTGLMSYRPNVDAVVYFVREILPRILHVRPTVIFSIVGAGASQEVWRLAGPSVVVTDAVEDVRPYIAHASAFVVPLRMGSGTRLKVLEALAMGKAVVSTSLGCEGIAVRDGEHLLVADDPGAFAQSALRLLERPALAGELGRRGRAVVEGGYGWASVVERLEAFYAHMLGPRRTRPGANGEPGVIRAPARRAPERARKTDRDRAGSWRVR